MFEIVEKHKGRYPERLIEEFLLSQKQNEIARLQSDNAFFDQQIKKFEVSHFNSKREIGKNSTSFTANRPSSMRESLNPKQETRNDSENAEKRKMVGLINIGNTCYFNSLLQTLFFIPEFRERLLLIELPTSTDDSIPKSLLQSFELIFHLKVLFREMLSGKSSLLNPSDVCNSVFNQFGERVVIGKQQDMVEYLMIFIDQISKGVKFLTERDSKNTPSTQAIKSIETESDNTDSQKEKNFTKNFVEDVFSGQLVWSFETASKAQTDTKQIEEFGPLIVNVDQKNLTDALLTRLNYELIGFKPEVILLELESH